MATKEQELTFENIIEFFSIADELVAVVAEDIDDIEQSEILERLDIVESFVEQLVDCSEVLSEDYTKLVRGEIENLEQVKEDIEQQIVLIVVALNNCKEKLLSRLENVEQRQ